MYKHTGDPLFMEAAGFWYEQTLAMAKFEDGLRGYKTFVGTDAANGEWHNARPAEGRVWYRFVADHRCGWF